MGLGFGEEAQLFNPHTQKPVQGLGRAVSDENPRVSVEQPACWACASIHNLIWEILCSQEGEREPKVKAMRRGARALCGIGEDRSRCCYNTDRVFLNFGLLPAHLMLLERRGTLQAEDSPHKTSKVSIENNINHILLRIYYQQEV